MSNARLWTLFDQMSTVISVENISKAYRLGVISGGTLKEDVSRWWARLQGKADPNLKIGEEHHARKMGQQFWALKDVSFDVKEGEVLGIVGRNGAGKSTLLKILSQVTTPTSGQIKIMGRIASLLEVGTGFHPDLTGRENVFLNGAILGMTKAEIRSKFDEIVAFSGIEEFIDTPVKRYSSGMYVRLAFAVAAHLEPEILIIDEVLAVGDAEFQKKCLGKMKDVAGHGRTVLFVSHNLSAVRALCSACIWVDSGCIRGSGPTSQVLDNYQRSSTSEVDASEAVLIEDPNKQFQVVKARVTKSNGELCSEFLCDEEISLVLFCQVRQLVPGLYGYLQISRRDGIAVLESDSFDPGTNPVDGLSCGEYTFTVTLPARSLSPGDYVADFCFASPMGLSGHTVDNPGEILSFSVSDPNSRRGNNRRGFFGTLLAWKVSPYSPVLRTIVTETDVPIPVGSRPNTSRGVNS
jgi:lipopolysaccharide transport system ATP-binding protein